MHKDFTMLLLFATWRCCLLLSLTSAANPKLMSTAKNGKVLYWRNRSTHFSLSVDPDRINQQSRILNIGTSSMVHTTTVARVTEGQVFLAAALIFAAGSVAPLAYKKVKEIVKPGGNCYIFFPLAALQLCMLVFVKLCCHVLTLAIFVARPMCACATHYEQVYSLPSTAQRLVHAQSRRCL
jgi:hypothetical protein